MEHAQNKLSDYLIVITFITENIQMFQSKRFIKSIQDTNLIFTEQLLPYSL